MDSEGVYINAPAVLLPTADKALLAILNSKIVWFFLKSICVVRSGGYIEVKPQYFEQIPIVELKNDDRLLLIENAEKMITLYRQLMAIEIDFNEYCIHILKITKLSKKLENIGKLEFDEFLIELKKQKINTDDFTVFKSLKLQFDGIKAIKSEIDQLDQKIDAIVYALYELSDDEIAILEG